MAAIPSVIAVLIFLSGCSSRRVQLSQRQEIFFADPTIFSKNGKFYMSGTRGTAPVGFSLLESADLKNWTPAISDTSLILAPGRECFGDRGFWAPQFFQNDNEEYYLAYTANEQVAIANASDFPSDFTQKSIRPVDPSEKNIDPFLYKDDDGKYYLYHVRFNHGNYIWVAEYDPVTATIDPSTLTRCFGVTQDWEDTKDYPADPIMEGPTLIKLKDTYYLFYSANHFMSRDYAVGYATAPSPMGPWTKNPANPVIHRSIVGENGSGHGDVFTDNDGNLRYVYHVHYSDSVVSPRRTRIVTLHLNDSDTEGVPYKISAEPTSILKPLDTSKL